MAILLGLADAISCRVIPRFAKPSVVIQTMIRGFALPIIPQTADYARCANVFRQNLQAESESPKEFTGCAAGENLAQDTRALEFCGLILFVYFDDGWFFTSDILVVEVGYYRIVQVIARQY